MAQPLRDLGWVEKWITVPDAVEACRLAKHLSTGRAKVKDEIPGFHFIVECPVCGIAWHYEGRHG